MGTLDKTIRISIALILLGMYIGGNIPEGTLSLIVILISDTCGIVTGKQIGRAHV